MVHKGIARQFEVDDLQIDQIMDSVLAEGGQDSIMGVIDKTVQNFEPGAILKGKIANYLGNDVIIEVGLKSEGVIDQSEFDDPSEIHIGDSIEVLLEAVESDSGLIILSKRKADRIRGWERVIANYNEGDTIAGKVARRIKGGLLVDVGVPVFLPASQVDIRRPSDIAAFIGKTIDAKILKIDQERRNIVISRRKLLEETRAAARSNLLADIEVGQIRTGVVKNIADFGAFVDLGGLDGLLHITDMSWGRVSHPSQIVHIDEEIEIKILNIDREREKIALGLKQKSESPWASARDRYSVGAQVKGLVVNIMSYGAFVKLEEGVEGLIHISEMSWTKRINHPSEMLSVGQEVDVAVLDVNPARQEISLGMKQLARNPWDKVAEKYPPGTVVEGKIRNLASYGAFIEIEEGIDGLLHVSDMSWTKKIGHPSELFKKSQDVKCIVLSVDQNKQRIALGLKQMTEDPWVRAIPDTYIPGQIVQGKVTKLTNFGVFVELEPDLEGLLHISELSDQKVEGPQDIVNPGQDLEVKILRVDIEDRKIGLSLKRALWAAEDQGEQEPGRTQRGGLDGTGAMGTDIIDTNIFRQPVKPDQPADQPAATTEQAPAAAVEPPPATAPEPQAAPDDAAAGEDTTSPSTAIGADNAPATLADADTDSAPTVDSDQPSDSADADEGDDQTGPDSTKTPPADA